MNRLLPLIGVMIFTGCQSLQTFDVRINSSKDDGSPGTGSFFIFQGNPRQDTHSPEFLEFSGYIRSALEFKGFTPSTYSNSDLLISFRYGIDGPSTSGGFQGPESGWGYPLTPNNPAPSIGNFQISTYLRKIDITAIEGKMYRMKNITNAVWAMKIRSDGYSGDLRSIFPHMVKAAAPYLGELTGNEIKVVIPGSNK